MWSKHAETKCKIMEADKTIDRFVGVHRGYMRLNDPVLHTRELLLHKNKSRLIVKDTIECNKSHFVEQFWHFSELCNVKIVNNVVEATNGVVNLCMRQDELEANATIYRGSKDPPCGWVSRSYNKKMPSSSIAIRHNINKTTEFVTEFSWTVYRENN